MASNQFAAGQLFPREITTDYTRGNGAAAAAVAACDYRRRKRTLTAENAGGKMKRKETDDLRRMLAERRWRQKEASDGHVTTGSPERSGASGSALGK
ncbi:unnamed protein product [Heligmosomoides polygyrus]|uniref:IBB domain-containing protein n=1 Tax=Heligmosomoides polygyrus TaxID=6339 RepID=A0A183G037_HELPZ|nr:unnamed protein product [Heligmosomoides polygyrus]